MKFITNLSSFVKHGTTIPELYDVLVTHIDGDIYTVEMPRTVLFNVPITKEVREYLEAAAKNNYESSLIKSTQ